MPYPDDEFSHRKPSDFDEFDAFNDPDDDLGWPELGLVIGYAATWVALVVLGAVAIGLI